MEQNNSNPGMQDSDSEGTEKHQQDGTPNPLVTVETVTELPGGGTKSVTLINLEQCSICSTFYEQVRRAIPQPNLNRLICKLLEIQPEGTPSENQAFLTRYIAICTDCTKKVKRYERLRIEMETMKNDLVSSVVDTLVHIRPNGNTPIHAVRNQIFKRWSTVRVGNSEVIVASRTPKPVKAFVINPADKDLKAKVKPETSPTRIQPVTSSQDDMTSNQWIYNVLDPDDPNLTVAEEVTVSTPREELLNQLDGDDNDCGDSDSENYIGGNNSVWLIKETDSSDNTTIKPSSISNLEEKQFKSNLSKQRKSSNKGTGKGRIRKTAPPYFCDDCGRIFGKWATYKLHRKNCLKEECGRTKFCPMCSEDFSTGSWQDFKGHFDELHPRCELERCITCRMDFLPTTLKTHICGFKAVDYASLGSDFKCDICDKAYVTRANLTDHIRRAHKDSTKWTCEACNKTYSSKMLLDQHTKSHNRVASKFECKICGDFSTSAWGLKQHSRIHTGELPFKCNICDKAFRCGSILKNHSVTHTLQKNFSCEICGMKFGLQGTMTRHWKRHMLPDTNYTKKCPICLDTKFKKVWVLKDHMVKKHAETPQCEEVMEKYKDFDDRPKAQFKLRKVSDKSKDKGNLEDKPIKTSNKRLKRSSVNNRPHANRNEIEVDAATYDSDGSASSYHEPSDAVYYISNALETEDDSEHSETRSSKSDTRKQSRSPRKRNLGSDKITNVNQQSASYLPRASRVSPRRKKNNSTLSPEEIDEKV